MKRKLLTVEDLLKFCEEQKFNKFSSKESGYKLSVQVPAIFEEDKDYKDSRKGLMRVKIKVFHTGLNRNGSYISEEAAKNAMPSIKNRPILAAIHQLDDGTWDFETHNMEIIEDENGKEEIRYIESQIGSFSEEEPFFEYDEENDKNFVCAYAWIPEEYTKAAEIIRAKNGTKNSCELSIDELAYNAKEKCLDFISFYVEGSTFLGKTADGTEIGEGMLGSRADISDFSYENNSIKFNRDDALIEILDKLNTTLSKFNINNEISEEGGKDKNMDKFNELLSKYGKTIEDIDFEYENLSDEDLEAKFVEVFGEEDPEDNPEDDNSGEEPSEEGEDDDETGTKEDNACGGGSKKKKKKHSIACSYEVNGETKVFEVSLQEKIYAIQDLVNATYAEADNTYYGVTVYENHVIMCDYWSGRYFKQSYATENDSYLLTGDRVEVYAEFVTAEEQKELENIRSNYSTISEELKKYQTIEENAKKDALFKSDDYKNIAKTDAFAQLEANHAELSLEEVTAKLDAMLLSFAKTGSITFSSQESNKTPQKKILNNAKAQKKTSRYGSLLKAK